MSKPTLQSGFLGGQPKFKEVGLKLDSHDEAQFQVKDRNYECIKLKCEKPVKTVANLIRCDKEETLPENVLIQRKDGGLNYNLVFPDNGWYKFSIFALPETDESKSLPGVYNYLIEVSGNKKVAYPFAKVYTKFYADECILHKPLYLKKGNKSSLKDVDFKLEVPGAKKVAVHAGEEWFQLNKSGSGVWECEADLSKYATGDTKVTVNGNYDEAGTSYSVLLEYII